MIPGKLNRRRLLGPVALAFAALVAVQGCKLVGYSVRLTALSLTPGTASIAATTTQQFTVNATYNDESTRDVTAEATWSSSDPAVATVNGAGVATPLHAGTTTVSATLGDQSVSATLTVTRRDPRRV